MKTLSLKSLFIVLPICLLIDSSQNIAQVNNPDSSIRVLIPVDNSISKNLKDTLDAVVSKIDSTKVEFKEEREKTKVLLSNIKSIMDQKPKVVTVTVTVPSKDTLINVETGDAPIKVLSDSTYKSLESK